jgi:ankyrin repeat protein
MYQFKFLFPQPPLVHAVLNGNLEEVEKILEIDPEAVCCLDAEGRSPLHAAAFMGYQDIVEILITKGNARVNSKDNQWLTPLHRACRSSAEVVGLLCSCMI